MVCFLVDGIISYSQLEIQLEKVPYLARESRESRERLPAAPSMALDSLEPGEALSSSSLSCWTHLEQTQRAGKGPERELCPKVGRALTLAAAPAEKSQGKKRIFGKFGSKSHGIEHIYIRFSSYLYPISLSGVILLNVSLQNYQN